MSADLGAPSVVLFAPACTCSTPLPSQALPLSLQMSLETLTPAQPELRNTPQLGEWDEKFRFGWCFFSQFSVSGSGKA